MQKKKSLIFYIIDFIMLAALAFLYISLGFSLGIKIILGVMLTVLTYKYSYKTNGLFVLTILISLSAAYLTFVKNDLFNLIIVFLDVALLPIVAGNLFKSNYTYLSSVCFSAASNMCVTVLTLVKLKFFDKVDLLNAFIKAPVENAFEPYKDLLLSYGISINDIINSVSTFLPSVIIIISAVTALFYIMLSKKIIWLLYKDELKIGSFSQLKLKKSFGAIFALTGLAIIFLPQSSFSDTLINIEIVISFAYFICGISFVDFYFRKTGLWISVRLILYALAFLITSVLGMFTLGILNPYTVLVTIAIFDTARNYRKLDE